MTVCIYSKTFCGDQKASVHLLGARAHTACTRDNVSSRTPDIRIGRYADAIAFFWLRVPVDGARMLADANAQISRRGLAPIRIYRSAQWNNTTNQIESKLVQTDSAYFRRIYKSDFHLELEAVAESDRTRRLFSLHRSLFVRILVVVRLNVRRQRLNVVNILCEKS